MTSYLEKDKSTNKRQIYELGMDLRSSYLLGRYKINCFDVRLSIRKVWDKL